jgi:hypothetical protein
MLLQLAAILALGERDFIQRAAGKSSTSPVNSITLKLSMSAGVDGRPWRSMNARLA